MLQRQKKGEVMLKKIIVVASALAMQIGVASATDRLYVDSRQQLPKFVVDSLTSAGYQLITDLQGKPAYYAQFSKLTMATADKTSIVMVSTVAGYACILGGEAVTFYTGSSQPLSVAIRPMNEVEAEFTTSAYRRAVKYVLDDLRNARKMEALCDKAGLAKRK